MLEWSDHKWSDRSEQRPNAACDSNESNWASVNKYSVVFARYVWFKTSESWIWIWTFSFHELFNFSFISSFILISHDSIVFILYALKSISMLSIVSQVFFSFHKSSANLMSPEKCVTSQVYTVNCDALCDFAECET